MTDLVEHVSYDIRGGDYGEAGAASRAIKAHLKAIGARSDAIRRAMIAAYEAEMNVVIHARNGRLEAAIDDHRIDVDVIDEGPGIPDVERALTPGFSTASPEARALGFGAGLGLPNIRRNSDSFALETELDKGTTVRFSVLLHPERVAAEVALSLAVNAELCRDCRRCLTACPTGAVRVRDGVPSVITHLCIDCTCCIAVCEAGALGLAATAPDAEGLGAVPLAVPPAFLAGFGERVAAARVHEALADSGFAEVCSVDGCETALRTAVTADAAGERPHPVLSPVCPSVVDLIELRFPSLIAHLAPFASPWESLATTAGADTVFVVSCPGQRSALAARGVDAAHRAIEPALLRDLVLSRLAGRQTDAAAPVVTAAPDGGPLRVTGIDHVVAVLEQIEDGLLTTPAAIELYVCDGGCFGSPLLADDPFLAAARAPAAAALAGACREPVVAAPRRPFAARPGIRLDPDMAKAIEKLARLDAVRRDLPGKDCGVCGAPTCAALAEDVVLGRADVTLCPYRATDGG